MNYTKKTYIGSNNTTKNFKLGIHTSYFSLNINGSNKSKLRTYPSILPGSKMKSQCWKLRLVYTNRKIK